MQSANLKTGVPRKQSTLNFPKNEHFLLPETHACVSGGQKSSFLGRFSVLCFLVTPVLKFAVSLHKTCGNTGFH